MDVKKATVGLMIAVAIISLVRCCNNGGVGSDKVCPKCKSDSIKEMVVYGLLTPEEKANSDSFYNALKQQGKVYGGCCVRPDRFYCYNCGHRW